MHGDTTTMGQLDVHFAEVFRRLDKMETAQERRHEQNSRRLDDQQTSLAAINLKVAETNGQVREAKNDIVDLKAHQKKTVTIGMLRTWWAIIVGTIVGLLWLFAHGVHI